MRRRHGFALPRGTHGSAIMGIAIPAAYEQREPKAGFRGEMAAWLEAGVR